MYPMELHGGDLNFIFSGIQDQIKKEYDIIKNGGCYYISPQICKDITIIAGVRGEHAPNAIKILRKNILNQDYFIKHIIPIFEYIQKDIISCYAGELAECLVEAACMGKGIEIAVGYPKILVFNVN